jgi:hypothetical protein
MPLMDSRASLQVSVILVNNIQLTTKIHHYCEKQKELKNESISCYWLFNSL